MFQTILVGTDGSDTARLAVEHAVTLAGKLEAEVTVVSAHPPQDREIALALLRDVEVEHGRRVRLATRAVPGPAADALVSVAGEGRFDLVVVGNRGMDRAARILGVSVPQRVSQRSPSSVLIVDTVRAQPATWGSVVVGADGSPASEATVETAFDLCGPLGADLTIAIADTGRRAGDHLLRTLLERYPGASGVVLEGPATDALAKLAESRPYDLLVMSGRVISGPKRLLGSVPARVSRRARTSVLIVNTAGIRRARPRPGKGVADG